MHKVSYVLTERFCQDPLENYFGKQRSSGVRKDNPTLYDFGYNDNTIRNQKVFKPITTGNVRDEHLNFEIDTEPVLCHKKYKQSNLWYPSLESLGPYIIDLSTSHFLFHLFFKVFFQLW